MSKILIVLAVLGLSLSSFARGGDELLNGGDALSCLQYGAVRIYQQLDLYEGRARYGYTYQDIESLRAGLDKVIAVLEEKDPSRACLYRNWIRTFIDETEFIGKPLSDLHDEGHPHLQAGCTIEQVAVQSSVLFQSGKRYRINWNIFSNFSSIDAAALIVHEVVYREARSLKVGQFRHSQAVRKFVAYLFSNEIRSESKEQYDLSLIHI